jgi:hypothetical protein
VGLINYVTRGISNMSYNARIDIVDANVLNTNISTTYLSYILARRILSAERIDNCAGIVAQLFNGTIGQYAYGQGFSYESTNENYRYSGCTIHGAPGSCGAGGIFGGTSSSSLLSPYPFDGNTVECPIDCITNTFNKDVLIFFHGPATCYYPPTIFFDDSIAFNVITYSAGNCGSTQGFSLGGQAKAIMNKFSVIDPNQGNVCSQRAISRDHSRII